MLIKKIRQEDIDVVEKVLNAAIPEPVIVADIRRTGPGLVIEISVFFPARTISLEDCAAIARVLAEAPEITAAFGENATLSVASPGLGRRLTTDREMAVFTGREVVAAWRDPESRTEHEEACVLESADGTGVTLRLNTGIPRTIDWNDVRNIRLSETGGTK